MVFPLKPPFSYGFPMVFPLKPPFSYGFPMVFPLKPPFSYDFPMVFPLKPPFSYGFPMVFPLRPLSSFAVHCCACCRRQPRSAHHASPSGRCCTGRGTRQARSMTSTPAPGHELQLLAIYGLMYGFIRFYMD